MKHIEKDKVAHWVEVNSRYCSTSQTFDNIDHNLQILCPQVICQHKAMIKC